MVRTHPRRPIPSSSREWQTILPSFSPSCCMAILLSLSCCCYLLQYSASSFCESSRPLWPTVAHAFSVAPIRSRNEAPPIVSFTTYTNNIHIANNIKGSSRLYSLKPAAIPLMDCGKALARSGELLIDLQHPWIYMVDPCPQWVPMYAIVGIVWPRPLRPVVSRLVWN